MKEKRQKTINRLIYLLVCFTLTISAISPLSPVAGAEETEQSQIMVSIGDSYSSGEGIPPFYGPTNRADQVYDLDWLAHRSQYSWPGMLRLPGVIGTMSDHHDNGWYFVAVSGAVTNNLYYGQKKSAWKEWGKYKSSDIELPAQLEIFDKLKEQEKSADYVTVTIGGNDVDFVGVLASSMLGCNYLLPTLSVKLDYTWHKFYKIGGIREDIRRAYEKIAEKAGPQARIIVAGYPQLMSENKVLTDPNQILAGTITTIDPVEVEIIDDAVTKFNNELNLLVNQCRDNGMNIYFVSVEEAFNGHEAYAYVPYINGIILRAQSHDLDDRLPFSAYSIHPNLEGAQAYAECVQRKIDELEASDINSGESERTTSEERDIVLALDVSGSMSGTPMEETRKAATNFINTILDEDASIGIVTYNSSASILSDFSTNKANLINSIDGLYANGGTNIDDGLTKAHDMLSESSAKKKIIVLMSDGEPNDGRVGEQLIDFAQELKDEGILIYTLGFFEDLSYKSAAQDLMERIASDGCHYEVDDAENLVFFFGDVADQINGQRYIYVRIACPVDVTVSYQGEKLDSSLDSISTRTSFGSLSFEQSGNVEESNNDDRVKVLRLKEGTDYDIHIEGTGRGHMTYTIGFQNEDGTYSDLRRFVNVKITRKTVVDTVAKVSDVTELNVDDDGDGSYDTVYRARANERGKIIDRSWILYLAVGAVGLGLLLLLVLVIRARKKHKQTINS